jgi:DNA-binding transcriptional LysR family regulator
MEIRELRSFVAVAEELHFGRAAARLGLVQPAVSQHLGRLERELGVRLLDRSPRRVALTGAGARLLAEARAALAGVDRVRDVAEALSHGHSADVVRIGTAPGLGHRLAKGLAAMHALAPNVEPVIVGGEARAHAAAVMSGALDAALVRGELPGVDAKVCLVGTDAVSVLLPARHPAAALQAVPVSALVDLRLRLPARAADPVLHDAVLARCRSEGIDVRRGRDIGSLDHAALEIGAAQTAWTPVHREGWTPPSCSVEIRPFDPPLCIPVQVLLPPNGPEVCEQGLVDAFR